MFESSLKFLLGTPKWFNAIQVLKLFLFLPGVTWTKTDVWEAIVVHATESWKNCSKPP